MTTINSILRRDLALPAALMLLVSVIACAQQQGPDDFIAEAPSAVFAAVDIGDTSIILLSHEASLRGNGVVSGAVYAQVFRGDTNPNTWHRGYLYSDHAPGFANDTEYVFQMYNPETYESELVYFSTEGGSFRIFPVPARFIGRMAIWNGYVFYSTEHYEDNIHYVNLDDGEVQYVAGTGIFFSNTDFWIIDGVLIVTEYGDRGAPHRLDTSGLRPAPDVVVSGETKVGFNLRNIRNGQDLERFEQLLGIR